MSVDSAGILLFRYRGKALEVFLVHPGGPFWVNRDVGAWSVPKGLFQDDEKPLEAARREFREETGFEAEGEFIELGKLKQPGGKTVHAWALEKDIDASKLRSNTFTLEWPRGSGVIREYPEVDRGQWFGLAEAKGKILTGQAAFLDRLVERMQHTAQGNDNHDTPA